MYTFRRVIVPVLVIVVLLAAFVFRLSSCSSDAATSGASSSPSAGTLSPEASPSPSEKVTVSPTAPYSGAEIRRIYESLGLKVVEIRNAGDHTMVHYYKPTGVPDEIISRFDWFDRETGARELVYGWAYTDKFEIKADKSFTVLTTGLSYVDGGLSFPKIFRSGYDEVDGATQFAGDEDKYYAPIANSYTVGIDRRENLTDINFNTGFLSLGFGPQEGYEGEFYAASESIPKMDIKNEDGYSTITLYKTTVTEGAEVPEVTENAYCSLVSVAADGTDTVITLKLSDNVSRYTMSAERSPQSGLPYAVIEFTNVIYDYPAGW